MPYHLLHRRKCQAKRIYQFVQRLFLRLSACVARLTRLVESAHVTNAYRTGIPPHAMRPVERHITPRLNAAIQANYVMITNAPKSAIAMPCINNRRGNIVTDTCGRAMNNDCISHH
ncbi:hypothetical protein SDC9_188660 [bioreactor metagenome]|uniref:Uncharacterized protein n=1 Tax=bioreactor metagenome TaxID=1076179 RepID=A0A645HPZ2_9ZZZZ